MKKISILAFALLLLATSCHQEENFTKPENQGIEMTLTATIGCPTKVSYEWDDANKLLKSTWAEGDQISVITLDGSRKMLSNDIFTLSTGAGTTSGTFTGTYSDPEGAKSYRVFYPALTETVEKSGNTVWQTPAVNYENVWDAEKGTEYLHYNAAYYLQAAGNSTDHLAKCVVLNGDATLSEGNLSADLGYLCSVIKLDITMPNDWTGYLSRISLTSTTSTGGNRNFLNHGWFYSYVNAFGNAHNVAHLCFGLEGEYKLTPTGITPTAGESFSVYMPICVGQSGFTMKETDKWTLCLIRDYSELSTKVFTFKADKEISAGKVYTLTCDFTK